MAAEVITTDDLREFKIELLEDLKRLLKEHSGQPTKKWLKSYEVRKLLDISPGTLQNLRVNGSDSFINAGISQKKKVPINTLAIMPAFLCWAP